MVCIPVCGKFSKQDLVLKRRLVNTSYNVSFAGIVIGILSLVSYGIATGAYGFDSLPNSLKTTATAVVRNLNMFRIS